MNEGYIKKGLYDGVVAALPGIRVIWQDQNEPRPARPYFAMKILTGPLREGHDEEIMNEDDKMEMSGSRMISVSMNFYGTKALEGMAQVQSRLQWQSVRDILAKKNLVFVSDSGVRDLSQLLENQTETRSQMDATFRFTDTGVDEGVGIIERVEVAQVDENGDVVREQIIDSEEG